MAVNWGWLVTARKIMGKITDWAIWGRAKGWWNKTGPGSIPGPKQ